MTTVPAGAGLAQDDDRPSGEDLRSSAPAAADEVDDVLEVLKVTDSYPDERVRVSGERERFDDLGEVGDGCVDVGHLCAGCEAEFDECLDVLADEAVIEHGRVAADESVALEAVDAPLRRGWREADEPAGLAC